MNTKNTKTAVRRKGVEAWALACSTAASACTICCCTLAIWAWICSTFTPWSAGSSSASTSPALTIWLSSNRTLVTTPGMRADTGCTWPVM